MTSFTEFKKASRSGNLIPLFSQFPADLETPLSLLMRLQQASECFLLESLEDPKHWGRFSFIGMDPKILIKQKGNRWVLEDRLGPQKVTQRGDGNPLPILKQQMDRFQFVPHPLLPKLCGGAIGFLGYDTVRFFEKIPDGKHPAIDFPDAFFGIYDEMIIFDHLRQVAFVVVNAFIDEKKSLKQIYEQTCKRIANRLKTLQKPLPLAAYKTKKTTQKIEWKPTLTDKKYFSAVEKTKEYIRAGDVFQLVLSDRWTATAKLSPLEIYRKLRQLNPSPYLFYLKMGKYVLAGSSPEVMVRLEGRKITLRPIAGTKPRGHTIEEDLALEQEMIHDPKERAEHLMLVDLGRNDVGRVAEGGSVRVSELMVTERYSHVMHLVSNVEGELCSDKTPIDVLQSCFPAGTLSGAPKIRAMEIIEELEGARRGPYGGCIGYIDFAGNMDMAITIRSIAANGKELFVQSGGGIVFDSNPKDEMAERQNKAKAVMEAVKLACSS